MKQTINLYQFRDAFQKIRPNNFSYHGLGILFEHLTEQENEMEEELELDVIAICCDYTEADMYDIAHDYNVKPEEEISNWADLDEEEKKSAYAEYLETWINDRSYYFKVTDTTFIYRQF